MDNFSQLYVCGYLGCPRDGESCLSGNSLAVLFQAEAEQAGLRLHCRIICGRRANQLWQLANWLQALEGALLAVGGALAVSGYLLIGQKILRQNTGLLSYTVVVYSSAAVLLLARRFSAMG